MTLAGPETIVGATTRSADRAAHLRENGVPPFVFDGTAPGAGLEAALARASILIVSVPPGHAAPEGTRAEGGRAGGAGDAPGDPVLRWYGETIARGAPRLEWIGYLSTIGVYGNRDGAWIDETAAPDAVSPRALERVAAEEAWADVAARAGVPLAVLRLSGIYGPGRSAFDKLAAGRARRVVKPGQVFNRIHVDDIAGAATHLSARRIGGVFNVTDDEPAPPQDVIEHAARLAGLEVPPAVPFDASTLSPMAASFWSENKRVSNRALKATGFRLAHPTYRDGLAAVLAAGRPQASL